MARDHRSLGEDIVHEDEAALCQVSHLPRPGGRASLTPTPGHDRSYQRGREQDAEDDPPPGHIARRSCWLHGLLFAGLLRLDRSCLRLEGGHAGGRLGFRRSCLDRSRLNRSRLDLGGRHLGGQRGGDGRCQRSATPASSQSQADTRDGHKREQRNEGGLPRHCRHDNRDCEIGPLCRALLEWRRPPAKLVPECSADSRRLDRDVDCDVVCLALVMIRPRRSGCCRVFVSSLYKSLP